MIITSFLDFIYGIFLSIFTNINIPSIPTEVHDLIDTIVEYLLLGLNIISTYTHLPYLLLLFSLVCFFDGFMWVYKILIWVIKKVPFINMK